MALQFFVDKLMPKIYFKFDYSIYEVENNLFINVFDKYRLDFLVTIPNTNNL